MYKIEEYIVELKNIAQLIVGDRKTHGTPVVRVDKNKLVQDYELDRLKKKCQKPSIRNTQSWHLS